jgi:hypothetical protein
MATLEELQAKADADRGKVVATTRKVGETQAEQKARMGTTSDDLNVLFENQMKLLNKTNDQGRSNILRRDVSGNVVDPNAPTGLAWLDAMGPNSPDPARQEMLRRRTEAVNADAGSPAYRAALGRDAVQALKEKQMAEGTRTAMDDTGGVNNYAGQVVKTPGSDVRVAYGPDGQPVGFSGVSQRDRLPPSADGVVFLGRGEADRKKFNAFANNLAADQSVMDAFGRTNTPNGTVTVGDVEDVTTPPSQTGTAQGATANATAADRTFSKTLRTGIQGLKNNNLLDAFQAGTNTVADTAADFITSNLYRNQDPAQPYDSMANLGLKNPTFGGDQPTAIDILPALATRSGAPETLANIYQGIRSMLGYDQPDYSMFDPAKVKKALQPQQPKR